MINQSDIDLQQLFCEVLIGASQIFVADNPLYIKHLSVLDQGIINSKNLEYYNLAINNELPDEAARLIEIKRLGDWTTADEAAVESHTFHLKNLLETKAHPHPLMNMGQINDEIAGIQLELIKLNSKKNDLMGITAEYWAARRLNRFYIYYCLFKDESLSVRALANCNFEEYEVNEVNELIEQYNNRTNALSISNIKLICVSDFFQNHFHLCGDDAFKFYGKPTSQLSYYQIHLFSYGTYFKTILSGENKPPTHILNDPDALIDWYNGAKSLDKVKESAGSGKIVGIAGASNAQLDDGGENLIDKLARDKAPKRGLALLNMLK